MLLLMNWFSLKKIIWVERNEATFLGSYGKLFRIGVNNINSLAKQIEALFANENVG